MFPEGDLSRESGTGCWYGARSAHCPARDCLARSPRASSLSPLLPFLLYVLGSRPSSGSQPSMVCQVAMTWTKPEGEGWRASRSPESRCSGTPPSTCKRFARTRVKRTARGPRPALILGGILQVHHEKTESSPKAGCAWLWALSWSVFLQIWLDVDALRPRVPTLGLVSAVAGMPGRDAVGRPEGERRRAGRSPKSRCSGTPPL